MQSDGTPRTEPSAQADGRPPEAPELAQYERDGAWVIAACGDFDSDSVPLLAEALDAAARRYPAVVLDASGVAFGDSAFLNTLVRVHRSTALRIVAPGPQVVRLFQLTGADTVLDLRSSVEDATGT